MINGLGSTYTTLSTIFDPTINIPNQYPPFTNNSINKGLIYNQIDLYFVIYSSMSSLNKFPINRTGNDFIQFDSYLIPSYSSMMNTTKINLDSSFRKLIYQIKMRQLAVSVSQIPFFIFAAIFCIYKIFIFRKKMDTIIEVLI